VKRNRTFILIFVALLVVYIVAQLNQPKHFDWTPTLRDNDKNPFGTFIPYTELKQIFAKAHVQSHKIPAFNVLHNKYETNSAYIFLESQFEPGKTDIDALLQYVDDGNTVFLSSFYIEKNLLDTLGVKMEPFATLIGKDSTSVNFVNPFLKAKENYTFKRSMIDGYFRELKKKDSTLVLGITQDSLPDFVRVQYGKGYFLLHAAPLCFSNYFMLYKNNHDYIGKALSYISPNVTTLHWDEYYKAGREGPDTPLRFFLSNTFLTWALWLTITAFVVFIFFEMKRRQRIIPIIEPLRNTTLDFIETVSSVYYSQQDNNSIARKKIQFWFDHLRQRYYISTQNTDDTFVQQLVRKSGVSKELIEKILANIRSVEAQAPVTIEQLTELSNSIDQFYQLSKT
jgi:hypothetical protein